MRDGKKLITGNFRPANSNWGNRLIHLDNFMVYSDMSMLVIILKAEILNLAQNTCEYSRTVTC